LAVTRNLGSWVRVAWPDAPDGVGYVHVTMGRIGAPGANPPLTRIPGQAASAPAPASSPGSAPATAATPTALAMRPSTSHPIATRDSFGITPAEHTFGVGGLVGTMSTYGATTRMWPNNKLGIQLGFTRDAMTSSFNADRTTSMQFEPGIVY